MSATEAKRGPAGLPWRGTQKQVDTYWQQLTAARDLRDAS